MSKLVARALLAAVGVATLATAPAHAIQVHFSNSWVPQPGQGRFLLYPSINFNASELVQYNYLDVGVLKSPGLGIAVETTYLGVNGAQGFGNSRFYLNYNLGELWAKQLPALTARLSPVADVKTGNFGRSGVGLISFVDWQINKDLKLYTNPGFTYALEGTAAPSRFFFNSCLDYRFLPWLQGDLELLSGFPNWNFGGATSFGVAPGLTAWLSDIMAVQASVRIPLVKADPNATAMEPPTVQLGWFVAW